MEPHSLVEERGKVVPSGRGLACGLQDQRLMARPPARAGGRSGLLSRGKSGNPNGYFLPSPKGYPPTSPARPAGGRAVTSVTKRGPQAGYPVRSTASPSTTPPEKGVPGEEPPPPGVLSPISSQEMGPRPGRPRCRSNGVRKNPQWAPLGRTPFPALPTAKEPHPIPHRVRLSPPPPGPPPAGPPGPRPEYSPGSARPPGERCPGQPPPPGESVKSQSSPPGTSPRPPHWRR